MNFRGIHHLAMVTADMEATIRFWRDLIGLRLIHGFGEVDFRQYFFEINAQSCVGRTSTGSACSRIACWTVERLRAIAEKRMNKPSVISDRGLWGLLIRDALRCNGIFCKGPHCSYCFSAHSSTWSNLLWPGGGGASRVPNFPCLPGCGVLFS
ncbi:MAG: VOC family protein [Candidatus Electrothrix sp. AU1_5]|nr:VOC family protein [Candidatus Electrothrix gigas]